MSGGPMSWRNIMNVLRVVEPIKRKKGFTRPTWQSHRFEIKGGITWMEAMRRDMLGNKVIENGSFRGIPIRMMRETRAANDG